jgi:hypothetical protein
MRRKIIILTLLAVLLLASPLQALAQGQAQQNLPGIQVTDTQVAFSLADINVNDFTLLSPLSVSRVLFSVPPNWRLSSGLFEVQYDVLLTGSDIARIQNGGGAFGGNLFVKFNGVIVATLPVNASGSYIQKIELPAAAFDLIRDDGRNIITFTFDSQVSCVYDISALVTVKGTSFLDIAYASTSPLLDLSRLPAPFHLENSIVPDGARVVVPDDADAVELQAAMNVMAGFGSMIADTYDLQLISLSNLSEADRANYHLIFVGLPAKLPVLGEIAFKEPVVDGKLTGASSAAAADGVLEMAFSPWNPMKAVLLVSGPTTEAILKAAHAFSSAQVLVFEDPLLAHVSSVQLLSESLPAVEDFSLADLGYTTTASGVLSGFGVNSAEFTFSAARNQLTSRDGYINLIYYHSGMLDYGTASFSLYLNGQVFSTIVFTEESEQVTDARIRIPPGLLRYGENRLEVRASMLQVPSCDQSLSTDPWLTISDQTSVHLPVSETADLAASSLRDLKFFPDLFVSSSDLGDVAFVLPSESTDKWNLAGKLAYDLGSTARPVLSNLAVAFGDSISEDLLKSDSLIVIGKAAEVPFLADINDQLPAPFDLAANTASERQLQISYRIPPGQNVGYLELMASPYNSAKSILVVSGNTDTGTSAATTVLLQGDLRDRLAGVFAVTNGFQIATGNALSTFSIVGGVVPGAEQVVNPLPETDASKSLMAPPAWLMPFLIGTGVLILLIGLIVFAQYKEKSRAQRFPEKQLAAEAEEEDRQE